MKSKRKVIDLFCGAGGLTLGFEKQNFESVLAIDMWSNAIDTFNNNRKNKVGVVKDIAEIDEKFIKQYVNEHVSGVIGGPPCQGFSLAGRRSEDDERNKLYKEYFKTLSIINPDFFVIENVTGILSMKNGEVKEDIIRRAKKIGYNVYLDKLVASDYGVPQNRVRVFFIGIKENLDKGTFKFPKKFNYKVTCEEAISDLPSLDKNDDPSKYKTDAISKYQKKMRKNCDMVYNHEQTFHTEETKKLISHVPQGGSIKDLPENLRGNRKYSSLLRRMNSKNQSNTIDTGHRTYFHYKENRILSVREAARIQSFPDNYIFSGSKVNQYKQVGNAVPPLLAEQVAKAIVDYLYE
ncbi:MAG: DNA cytosine methyltransferase [Bacilli bacterium]|nr:DNA cytosine methyltransferase [Bacilli bacterium]